MIHCNLTILCKACVLYTVARLIMLAICAYCAGITLNAFTTYSAHNYAGIIVALATYYA